MYVNNTVNEILRPEIVGGYDLTSMRSHFDQDSRNVITTSDRQIFYFNVESGEQIGKANIESTKLNQDERIVANDKLAHSYYVFTNHGRIFIWNLETRDWINELNLPVKDHEVLLSCKALSKRQYIYSIFDSTTNKVTLNYSMSRSERERPKNRETFGECTSGELNTFDIGCLFSESDIDQEQKSGQDKLNKQKYLAFLHGSSIIIRKVAINEKLSLDNIRIEMNRNFTCVRANTKKPMFAVGDTLGVIYLYTGNIFEKKTRSKLHWHSLPVNDLCFSDSGNTLFSVGGESGCVVIWDIGLNNIGKKRVVARLGMPIRYINCNSNLNQLILSFEDNEIQVMGTNERTKRLKTFTRRVNELYRQNDPKALRVEKIDCDKEKSVGLLWHSKTDTVVANARTGWLQFYSPKQKVSAMSLNFLKSNVLSLEQWARVVPSDITKATLTQVGDWLAFYETRESESSFPEIKLHIWQRSSVTNRWQWIQTVDRLHSSTIIVDLTFSPDGQFLVSVSEDGTFHLLHRVSLDAKSSSSSSKQMYAVGFAGNVPAKLPAKAAFSRDSSVMAMSLKNDTTLIWMILDPYKLVFECQLSLIEQREVDQEKSTNDDETSDNQVADHDVLGLHFGHHTSSLSLAPLCEVRTNAVRVWNILNPQEYSEYFIKNGDENAEHDKITASAFDQKGDTTVDHFAISTRNNMIMLFPLELTQDGAPLAPLIIVDASPTVSHPNLTTYYTDMCFTGEPILDIDSQSHRDTNVLNLVNRLCLINNHQELVSITDKLTLDRQTANNSCNAIKTVDMSELQAYFIKSASSYSKEVQDSRNSDKPDSALMTEKQRTIRKRIEVQKMLKDLLIRIPSQNLPHMDTLGPMILDKLI